MADEQPNGNGATVRWRLDQLERSQRATDEGVRALASMGERTNEQVNTLREDVAELKAEIKEIPVLRTEVASLVEGWRAVRNAFLAAAVGLIALAGSIIWQATA